jgi:NAD(P)-dependent dehydrogenase (short-subunit alcohol dehydrogenase family)
VSDGVSGRAHLNIPYIDKNERGDSMGKVCLITGGTTGIGRATAILAARAGYAVALTGRSASSENALSAVREIEAAGGRAVALAMTMADRTSIEQAFRDTEQMLGPIDALVNAAGTINKAEVAELDFDASLEMMATNVVGLMYACREATRRMALSRGGKGGVIVNVSSMAATNGGRAASCAYAASKGAVDTFTAGFAREIAHDGVRVNAVRPGIIETAMTAYLKDPERRKELSSTVPMGRVGQPEEVAELILWLMSDQASFVTGAHVNVSGGGYKIGSGR